MLPTLRYSRLPNCCALCQTSPVIAMTPSAQMVDVVVDRPYLVGVEVGPSVIRAGIFSAEFDLLGKAKVSTKKERGAASVIQRIARCVEYAVDECDLGMDEIRALGVGAPGRVDPDSGVAMSAPSLGWKEVPLQGALEKLLHVPVFVENYFRLSALGTYTKEIHTQPRRFAGLFLGPEIGGGLIVDGELAVPAAPDEEDCFDGGPESVFAVMPQEEFRHARIRDLRKAVRRRNPAVIEFARTIARRAGQISAELAQRFEPEILLLGGGLMDEMREDIMSLVEEAIQHQAGGQAAVRVEIVASVLGDLAGMTGGAVLAARKLAAVRC
jgi:glucokinase